MILKDFSGVSLETFLEERRPSWRASLRIADLLVAALEAIHSKGHTHNDLRPANILVSLDGDEVRLGALAGAMLRGEADPEGAGDRVIDWAYMSPEQTGRMNRRVDYRSDFYSLGIVLYRMLTGGFPFQAEDPLQWAHSHTARIPRPPIEAAPDLPPALSDIVMKLLAKDPEERYQSAQGLRYDFEQCLMRDEAGDRSSSFTLGTRDISDTLHIPPRIYGREKESAALLEAFRDASDTGRPVLVLVSGYSGIGKSSLVHDFRRTVAARGGNFLPGKFDEYNRRIPYSTLADAFRGLVQRILAGSEEEILFWRKRIGGALGPHGGIIARIIPQVELILGRQKPATELRGAEAQNRFHLVFRRFIGAIARPGEPLVLFLDDLQWADGGSLSLVSHLIGHPETRHLMIIGAYRANEVDASHPLSRIAEGSGSRSVVEISLGPPDEDSLRRMLGETLRCDAAAASPLARLLRRKTGGNPFFVSQFLRKLQLDGLIAFDIIRGKWAWDMERLSEAKVTDNVVELMAERIGRLEGPTREALKLAACLGNGFRLETLALISGRPAGEVAADLQAAMELELVHLTERRGEGVDLGSSRRYQWQHDRIQQAAYSMIPREEIPRLHLSIARRLRGVEEASGEGPGDAVFTVATHYNLGAALVTDGAERVLTAGLNLAAGLKAKASSAYPSAIHFLSAGAEMLGPDAWEPHYDLAFALHMALAESCFLGGRPEEVVSRAERLLGKARTARHKAAALRLIHNAKLTQGEIQGAVDAELQFLSLHGVDLPTVPSWEEAMAERGRVRALMAGRSIESIVDLPSPADPAEEAPMLITVPSYFLDKNLYILRVARMTALNLERGNTDASVLWYGSYGVVLAAFFDDFGEGYRFAKAALALMEKRGALGYKGKAYMQLGWTAVWTRPMEEAVSCYQTGFKAAIEAGDIVVACYCCSRLMISSLASGIPLQAFLMESESTFAFVSQAGFRDLRDIFLFHRQFAKALQGGTDSLTSFDDGDFDQQAFEADLESNRLSTLICWYWITRMRILFIAGDFQQALAAGDRAKPLIWASAGQLPYRDWHLYHGLSLAANMDRASEEERPERLETLAAHDSQFRRWSDANPGLFRHNHALLSAEIARVLGRDREAAGLYEESLAWARKGGFIPDEALAYELAARFHGAQGFAAFSDLYLRNARDRYRSWGAEAKAARLEALHPELKEAGGALPAGANPARTGQSGKDHGGPGDRLDFLAVLKASQAISGEIVLDKLLQTLMRTVLEGTGSQKAQLLLMRDAHLYPVAEAAMAGDHFAVHIHPDQMLSAALLPLSIVNYVYRTGEKVVLADSARPNPFSGDEYLEASRPKSVLCLPILRQSESAGILYLENNLVADAFTADRLAATELLASQAAISLENARLFEDHKRTAEALRESQLLLQNIIDHTTAVIFVKNRDGRYLLINRRFEEMFGVSRQTILGKTDYDIFPPESAKDIWARDRQVLDRGLPVEKEEATHFQGAIRTFISHRFPLLDESGNPYAVCGIATDITKVKEVEEQLRHSQKMEAVGRLAGGMAHDFNNMLTVINGYSLMVLESIEPSHPHTRAMKGILGAGEKAAGLTNQLLAYSRKQVQETRIWNLNTIVEEMAPMVRRLIGEDVELDTSRLPAIAMARLDRAQLEQIILNLAVNARDAMPEGGRLTLETANAVLGESEAGRHLSGSAGPHVMLAMSDTGMGMTPDVKSRIFEPFFTTKGAGAGPLGRTGTGLGLSVVYGIVKQSGGSISVQSEPGRGTTFRIYFPESRQAEETAARAAHSAPESYRGAETILLVEDEEAVRVFIRHALESQGYRVTEASRGMEALRILREEAAPIHFVLTDVVMPELGGLGMVEQLREIRPGLPVLYMSGYTEAPNIHARIKESGGEFIQKPFNPFELARRVRSILDGKAA